MSKAKIYTRFGDKGQTRLVDGSCVEKFNPQVEAYGCVDELNSSLGPVIEALTLQKNLEGLRSALVKTQHHLFRVGSLLACKDPKVMSQLPSVDNSHVVFLEKQIDQMSDSLPELKNFILPGGHPIACDLHISRTQCRRAERRTAEVATPESGHEISLIYLNRLSDFLFVAARHVNHQTGRTDLPWDKSE